MTLTSSRLSSASSTTSTRRRFADPLVWASSADKVRDQGFRSLAVVSSLDTQFAKGSEQAGFSIALRPVAVERLDDCNEPLLDIAGVTRDLFCVVQHLTEAVTVKRERHKYPQPSDSSSL